MPSYYNRHTMGQDWGGRRKENPPDAPRITRKQVEARAQELGVEIQREGQGMWFFLRDGKWYTLGQTNYLALWELNHLKK